MKLLLAFPRPLIPADTGGKIRSLQIFSRLAERMEIHAISFADSSLDGAGIEAMKKLFTSYTPVPWRESAKYSLGYYGEVLANQFSALPYSVSKYCLPRLVEAAAAVANGKKCDLLLCDFLTMAAALRGLPLRPRVIFQHNVEAQLRKRQWETEQSALKKWIFRSEWKRTRQIEGEICGSFDHVIAVSDVDRELFQSEYGPGNVSVIPTGVDAAYFQPAKNPAIPGRIVFVGSMDWHPNEDGVSWFLNEAYPKIKKAAPHASFTIVGRKPSSAMIHAVSGDSSVKLTGRVEDVRPYIAEAETVVVPLRIGGGTRIKIPEAMAMAKAVVSTQIGAEGLPFHVGKEILIEDSPEKFAGEIVELLQSPERRKVIEDAARDCVVRAYDWNSVVDRMEKILSGVMGESTRGEVNFETACPASKIHT